MRERILMMPALPFIILLCLLILSLNGAAGASQKDSARRTGQDQAGANTNEQAVSKPGSLSPYFIEWYIDINEDIDLKQIWRSLNIEIPDDASYRCGSNCSAETFDINTDDEQHGKIVALKVSFESGDLYQYLIFRMMESGSAKTEWKFIGKIDSRGQRFAPPVHRIESADNRKWFVIRSSLGKGSGMIAYNDVWYQISEKDLKPVLSYPVEGRDSTCEKQPGRSYKSILLRYGLDNGTYTVPIQFLISYAVCDYAKGKDSRALFAKRQKAYFVWNAEKDSFVLDKSRSEITEREMSAVFNIEGLSYEMFLEYNFNELLEMVKSRDAEQKEWLRKTLRSIPDSQRKAALLKALQQ